MEQKRGDGMSILIKGMEMPRDCYECKVWFECFDEKPPFNMIKSVCPLVEVKEPHGDLVDRDELLAEYDRQHKGPAGGARKIMEMAPTVIEAEGSKDE